MKKHYILNKIGAYAYFEYPPHQEDYEEMTQATWMMLNSVRNHGPLALQPIFIRNSENSFHNGRAVHQISDGITGAYSHGVYYQITIDDDIASQAEVLNAISASLAILERGVDDLKLIPIPQKVLPPHRTLEVEDAILIYEESRPERWDCESGGYIFDGQVYWGMDIDILLWETVATILNNEDIKYAAHFLKSSHDEFFIGDGLIRDVILEHENVPIQMFEAVKVENAIHNSYKVIEAIYGGTLSNSIPKIKKRLVERGIDPMELVGYETFGYFKRATIVKKIEQLRKARNNRAAHGRIHADRRITFYELLDFQKMAGHCLLRYIVKEYPDLKRYLIDGDWKNYVNNIKRVHHADY
jgi:hypothetical protein